MRRLIITAVAVAVAATACVAGADVVPADPNGTTSTTVSETTVPESGTTAPADTTNTSAPTTTTTVPSRPTGVVPPESVGEPWGDVVGLTMFRGNPTRTFYGSGPVPRSAPSVAWRFPDDAMCGQSPVGQENKVWCGSGWTGQPVVWERP
ncbi:MAG: hypothetical protein WBN71_09595, partial [Acidimicrobiia bacterium]